MKDNAVQLKYCFILHTLHAGWGKKLIGALENILIQPRERLRPVLCFQAWCLSDIAASNQILVSLSAGFVRSVGLAGLVVQV